MRMKKVYRDFISSEHDGSCCNRMRSSSDDAAQGGSDASGSDWDAASSITVVSREEGSGTRGAFTELFGVVDENDNDMTTLGRSGYKQHICYDENSI